MFTMPRDNFLDTPSSMTRAIRSATQCDMPLVDTPPDSLRVPHQGSSRSASALHSIMEQGTYMRMDVYTLGVNLVS